MKHNNISIFVPHVGCPCKCSFCNQHSIASVHDLPDAKYVKNICAKAMKEIPEEQRKSTEIAFFGGSFTAMERGYMESLLDTASAYVGGDGFSGIRISTRPDCIDEKILNLLKSYGVTAIELGVQSLNDNVLELNNRGHTANDAETACGLIRSNGFSLGLQMMIGMYGDSKDSLYQTVEKIVRLNPDTLRIYPVAVLKNTELEKLYRQGKYRPVELEQAVDICADLLDIFERNNIKIIRLGLHSETEMLSDIVAGVYHPAFRELCESKRLLRRVKQLLSAETGKNFEIYVNPANISKMVGQKRININELNNYGYQVQVKPDDRLMKNEIEVKDVSNCF